MAERNDYKKIIRSDRLREVIRELTEQGGAAPTCRSVWYVLRDTGEIRPTKNSYDEFNRSLSGSRDAGEFPYGLLAPTGGSSYQGLTLEELEARVEYFRRSNVVPELVSGELSAVLVEKVGLVSTIGEAVGWRIPVASPGGMVRKEWATVWLAGLLDLASRLGAPRAVTIVYLGDYDEGGDRIREELPWYELTRGVYTVFFGVTGDQIRAANIGRSDPYDELHIDGYISAVKGPLEFGRELREFIGLE